MLSALTLLVAFPSLIVAIPRDTIKNSLSTRSRNTYEEPRPNIHPLRDRSKLKYEIAGIVGAYLFWALVTIALIVLVRYRLRKKNSIHNQTLDMTMLKTFHHGKDEVRETVVSAGSVKSPSLLSPRIQNLKSWTKRGHKNTGSTSTVNSTQSHEQHKAQDMDDLSKLYAAVLIHDEEKSTGRTSARHSPVSPQENFPLSPGYPPEFAHLHNANAVSQPLKSPGLTQGFSQRLHHPMAPTPTSDSFPEHASPYYDPNISRNSSRSTRTTPASMISNVSQSLVSPKHRPNNISIRGQNISQPIGSPDLGNSYLYDETVPLSPRIYNPGPAPPTPGKKKQIQVSVEPIYELEDNYEQQQYQHPYPIYQEQQAPPVPPIPANLPLSPGLPKSPMHTPQLAQAIKEKRIPPSLALRASQTSDLTPIQSASLPQHPALTAGNAPTSKKLAFREMYGDVSLRSAPPTKTTFLDRPTKMISGPKTGVPYSPYMPNTPMTPITPRRLMNKQELKARRKEEKLKVLNEDDLVQDDEDMWGK